MPSANRFQDFAYYAFLPFVLGFLAYVGLGWYIFFLHMTGWNPLLVGLLCLTMVAFIYVLVRHTGLAMYEASSHRGWRRFAWVPFFLALFCFSGYGFLTSSMLIFVGPRIAREDVGKLLADLSSLRNAAASARIRYILEDERDALLREIDHPTGNCGFGHEAQKILDRVNASLRPYSLHIDPPSRVGSVLCNRRDIIEKLVMHFNGRIEQILASSRQAADLSTNDDPSNSVLSATRKESRDLQAVSDRLRTEQYFFDLALFWRTLNALQAGREAYNTQLSTVNGAGLAPAPPSRLEELGSPFDLLHVIWTERTDPKVWLLLILAVGCDVLASYLASGVFRKHLVLAVERGRIAGAAQAGGRDVTFLWQPEPHPLHRPERNAG